MYCFLLQNFGVLCYIAISNYINTEKISVEIWPEKPNLMKTINPEIQWTPVMKITIRHMIIKFLKMSDNVKTFKTVIKKRYTKNNKDGSNYLVRKNIRRQWNNTLKLWRIKTVNSKIVIIKRRWNKAFFIHTEVERKYRQETSFITRSVNRSPLDRRKTNPDGNIPLHRGIKRTMGVNF